MFDDDDDHDDDDDDDDEGGRIVSERRDGSRVFCSVPATVVAATASSSRVRAFTRASASARRTTPTSRLPSSRLPPFIPSVAYLASPKRGGARGITSPRLSRQSHKRTVIRASLPVRTRVPAATVSRCAARTKRRRRAEGPL